jgi:hypothetical protein
MTISKNLSLGYMQRLQGKDNQRGSQATPDLFVARKLCVLLMHTNHGER